MKLAGRFLRRTSLRLRSLLSRVFLSLWLKGLIITIAVFFIPFFILSYVSLTENIEVEKESLFQNFYLRAHALSLEIRTYLKDKVDLRGGNEFLVRRGQIASGYDAAVPEPVRSKVIGWLSDRQQSRSLIEFYGEPGGARPRIFYAERSGNLTFYIFEANFLSRLLDISQNVSADDMIFIYNTHEEPFISNVIENGYRVPEDWQASIHRLFWQSPVNSIQELRTRDQRFLIARYALRELPLIIYVARPYGVAMHQVEVKSARLIMIFVFVGLIVFLLMMYYFRDQLRTLKQLRAFIDGRVAAARARRAFVIRDERADIFTDIVAIRELEKKASRERDEAEQRTRAKADFLASMSHEIRNPLNAMLGITDLLRERLTDPEAVRYMNLVRDSGDSLLQIINDILDISKIESNKLTLEEVEFHVEKMVSDLRLFYSARAETLHNTLLSFVAPNAQGIVRGDATRFRQIVLNLLSNAIKFTDHGRIIVRVRRYLDNGYLHLFVHDTGIGISRENISRIFAAYEQADNSTARRFGGTGLGLSIVLRLAKLMQGQVRCRSRIGRGTSFHCSLYLPGAGVAPATPENPAQQVNDLSALSQLRVLVAEDDEINQMLMRENLKPLVAHVDIAANGLEAQDLYRHGRYDIVFMDILMPECDGLEATRAIRRFEQVARTPVVALSGNAMPEDIAAAKAAGCDLHLAKPVKKEQIIAALVTLCRR